MKRNRKLIVVTAVSLVLAAACALAALPAVPSEEAGPICEKALMNCLEDMLGGPFALWTAAMKISYCLVGDQFCRRYVEPYL
jgi:hypothetical protein